MAKTMSASKGAALFVLVAVGIIAAVAAAGLGFFASGGIPSILIEEKPNNEGIPQELVDSTVTGQMTYDMTVRYKDGTHTTYSETVQFPRLNLNSIADARNKEIASFDFAGRIKLNLPKDADRIRQNADILNTLVVYLNSTQIATKTSTITADISTLTAEKQIYKFNIPVTDLPVASGKYVLIFKTLDQVKFYKADFAERVIKIEASPALGLARDYSGVMKEVYVVNYRPTVTTSIENVPIYVHKGGYPGYEVMVGSSKIIIVKASNFTPSSTISFIYDTSAPQYQKNMNQSVWFPQSKDIHNDLTTDAAGTAQSKLYINTFDTLNCYHYYAKYHIFDGKNAVDGVLGCTVEDWKTATGSYPTN